MVGAMLLLDLMQITFSYLDCKRQHRSIIIFKGLRYTKFRTIYRIYDEKYIERYEQSDIYTSTNVTHLKNLGFLLEADSRIKKVFQVITIGGIRM